MLRMKKLGSLKNLTFRGKTNVEGRIAEKVGLGQFADLRGGLGRKRGVAFLMGG